MSYTLQAFAADCREILTKENNPTGRSKVRDLLQKALKDEEFVAKNFDESTPERKILYEDPDLGFCILAHYYKGAKESAPHDHGPSWAIYGQAAGETAMSDWELLEAASSEKPGKVRKTRTYKLTPGIAHVYNEGDLHSPSRAGSTRLIRIEGTNMEKVKRLKYEAA
jgi:predicted metal-dependent enzyme (double-stranded beta helix superfamily)